MSNEKTEIKGVIEKTKQFTKGHIITIEGVDYSGYGKLVKAKKGDIVEVDKVINGEYTNYRNLKVIKSALISEVTAENNGNGSMEKMSDLKNKTMSRCSAITNATNLCVARGELERNQILTVAEDLLKWIREGS